MPSTSRPQSQSFRQTLNGLAAHPAKLREIRDESIDGASSIS